MVVASGVTGKDQDLYKSKKVFGVVEGPKKSIRGPPLGLYSDHLREQTAQGLWSKMEARRSSNWIELKAIHLLTLVFFQWSLENQHMQVLSDNMTAVLYLSKQGCIKSKALMALAH